MNSNVYLYDFFYHGISCFCLAVRQLNCASKTAIVSGVQGEGNVCLLLSSFCSINLVNVVCS